VLTGPLVMARDFGLSPPLCQGGRRTCCISTVGVNRVLTISNQFNTMDNKHSDRLAHGGDLTYRIIGLAMRVHRHLGPGLLESVYETCLCYELKRNDIPFRRQVSLPVAYEDISMDAGYVADVIVADEVIVEIKSAEAIIPIHQAQLLTYMRFMPCHIGLLINFNTISLTDGIKRCVI
jgi:GxxExxY protein